ncbi:hypothetical protein CR983_02845 [Candidatus Saccharibacteria bacterium]|nr:MAG: hypothetical protein CR983_02845 [Candidatus Saccharibacteria bacterium]
MGGSATQLLSSWQVRLALIGGGLLLVGLLVYGLLTRPTYPDYEVSTTPLSPASHAAIDGDTLYVYNGAAFAAIDTKSGANKVLRSGMRFGAVSSLDWVGDRGVLVRFESIPSDGVVYDAYEREDINLVETESSSLVWYYDFERDSLELLDMPPDVGTPIAYNQSANSFYYITRVASGVDEPSDNPSLIARYALGSGEQEVVYEGEISSTFTTLAACGDTVCYIELASDGNSGESTQSKLYRLSGKKKSELITSTNGALAPTNRDGVFLYTEVTDDIAPEDQVEFAEDTIDSGYGDMAAEFFDVKTKKRTPARFNISSSDVSVLFDPGNEPLDRAAFIATGGGLAFGENVEGRRKQSTYGIIQTGSSIIGKSARRNSHIKLPGESVVVTATSSPHTTSTNQLLTSYDDSIWILSKKDSVSLDTLSAEQSDIDAVVTACTEDRADVDYTPEISEYKLLVYSDDKIGPQVREITNCLYKNNLAAALATYSFSYAAVDPESGRTIGY